MVFQERILREPSSNKRAPTPYVQRNDRRVRLNSKARSLSEVRRFHADIFAVVLSWWPVRRWLDAERTNEGCRTDIHTRQKSIRGRVALPHKSALEVNKRIIEERRFQPTSLLLVIAAVCQLATLPAIAEKVTRAEGSGTSTVSLADLRVEYKENPLGIDTNIPRLSWQLRSEVRGTMQAAYQVRVALSPDDLNREGGLVWDSGKVVSQQSTQVVYSGQPLRSRQRYHWQVRIWNDADASSQWSEAAWWEMGLLSREDWEAQWIAPTIDRNPMKSTPAPMLRSKFELRGKIARARAYVTSLGFYEFRVNGQRVGDALFTPGWTSFDKRLQYQVYDVTSLLNDGANAVGAVLGDGWYRRVPFNYYKQRNSGRPLAFLMQLEIVYEDARTEKIVSDLSWKTATGPILRSEIYNGELYDARLERDGWATASYDDHDWSRIKLAAPFRGALIATVSPPVRRIKALKPVRIQRTPRGETVVDMGQNIGGWVRLRVRGAAGKTVTLRHAEVLDREGNLYTESLRTAEPIVQYVLKGGGEETFEPHFTFQGFRYVAVEGYPGELTLESLTGIVVHSDMQPTGQFETSNALINQLHENIVWSLRGNYIDVPTDSPQRDERLGWTLDAQLFLNTAAFNMNVATLFTKWLGDLAADQKEDGAVPMEIPRANRMKYKLKELYAGAGRESSDNRLVELAGAPGYGDAATIVPWALYLQYGDVGILRAQYPSMADWVQYMENDAGEDNLWNPDPNLGDWLDVGTTVNPTWVGSTAFDLMATAFYAHSVDILQRTATVLHKKHDSLRYSRLLEDIRGVFVERFVSEDGVVGEGTQTAYVLALDFDLLPDALRSLAARHLAEDVRSRGHLTTGIAGTQRLLTTLTRFGYNEEAYMLLNRREMPSWLYSVTKGATTIWERWDGIRPDGSFQTPAMNSFNHYALGAVGEWMYGVMGGIAIDPAAAGYKHILIQPKPGGGLNSVAASHITPYGIVSVSWRIDKGTMYIEVAVPPNSRATVNLPKARLDNVFEGTYRLTSTDGISAIRQVDSDVVLDVGSGKYEFSYGYGGE